MRRNVITVTVLYILAALTASSGFGQGEKREADGSQACSGAVYARKEVSRPAKFTYRPDVGMTEEARANNLTGCALLRAVLCRSGRVTDIVVEKELPYGMTEKIVESLRVSKFTPAEKDGQEVSQRMRFEYCFNVR